MTAGIADARGYRHGGLATVVDTERPASSRPHGYACYRLGKCRCEICGDARRKYDRKQVVLAANGKSATVDAEPVRQHVKALQAAGMGTRKICEVSGVSRTALLKLLNGCPSRGTGPSRRVLAATADKLLAVQPSLDLLGGKTLLDPCGTRRRLQALVALGWAQAHLAEQIGWTAGNFYALIHGVYGHVTVDTARLVRQLFDTLADLVPAETNPHERRSASRARRYAAAREWFPPIAWDEGTIDDPTAHPNMTGYDETVVQALLAGQEIEYSDVDLREFVRRLPDVPFKTIAQRLGLSYDALYYRVRTKVAA